MRSSEYSEPLRTVRIVQVPIEELVVGDLMEIQEGMELPADVLLVDGANVETTEEMLDGEYIPLQKLPYEDCMRQWAEARARQDSKPLKHKIASPLLISGTKVRDPKRP